MSPLEAARAMAGKNASTFLDFDTDGESCIDGDPYATAHFMCVFCSVRTAFARDEPISHRPDCPWLSMPQIVAALEAAYGLMALEAGAEPIERIGEDGDVGVWAFCGRLADGPHWGGCLWVKLAYLVYGTQPR